MEATQICPLCNKTAGLYRQFAHQDFFKCKTCHSIFKHPNHQLSQEEELGRYQLHHNDPHDPDYRKFVSPLTHTVLEKFPTSCNGLDFGCGPGPVAAVVLREKGYSVNLYDPFFFPIQENLECNYDFIICCEVMEHFFHPGKEFQKLSSLLRPNGALIAKTSRLTPAIESDFDNWYYKDDPTHVFFYSDQTLKFIEKQFGFRSLQLYPNYFVFWK